MIFKKFSIIFSIILIIFSSSINVSSAISTVAPPPISNEYIKELESIDDRMYLLTKSIATKNFDESQINKDIKFAETLINSLSIKTSKLPEKDNIVILSMQNILNYYKISIIEMSNYLDNQNADDLIDAIVSFSLGYNSSASLRKTIGEVK